MRQLLRVWTLLLIMVSVAFAAGTEATLVGNFDRGKYLCIQIGPKQLVFEPLFGESFDASSWSRNSNCMIVADGQQFKIVNLDEKGIVNAKQIPAVNAYVVESMEFGKYLLLQLGSRKALFEVTSYNTYESSIWLVSQNCLIVEKAYSDYKLLNLANSSSVEAKLLGLK